MTTYWWGPGLESGVGGLGTPPAHTHTRERDRLRAILALAIDDCCSGSGGRCCEQRLREVLQALEEG